MAKKKAKAKKCRKIRGRDWHGWVCKMPKREGDPEKDWVLCYWAEPAKQPPINDGKSVRVKFVEVD